MRRRAAAARPAVRGASATIHRTNYEFFPPAHRHPVPSLCRLLPVLITYLADSERMHTTTHPAFYKRLSKLLISTRRRGAQFLIACMQSFANATHYIIISFRLSTIYIM